MWKKMKTETVVAGSNLEALQEAAEQEASRWKDDLIGRIVMQMNDDINEVGANENETSQNAPVTDSFQYIDGKLILRGVRVSILEKRRALQCTRCRRIFYEEKERDSAGKDVQLEALMRDHILSSHNEDVEKSKQSKSQEPIDVVVFPSCTKKKNKITYKLACPMMYTYRSRGVQEVNGAERYVCGYLPRNCSASILCKNGVYYRMKKGWNPDGSHVIHAPDVESTNRQIEIGKAKAMYMEDPTKTVEDVCNAMLNESNGQLKTSIRKLRYRMLWAKHKSYGVPEEERARLSFPCPHCDAVYKQRRHLTRHVKTSHQNPSGETQSSTVKSSSPRKSAPETLAKKAKKSKVKPKPNAAEAQEPPVPADAPSIVFNDPSVANSFVNKCISAIMQQVGVSLPGNSSSSAQVRPMASNSPGSASSDTIKKHENIPQQNHGPHHPRSGYPLNPEQWQQVSSVQSGGHPGFSSNQNPSSSGNLHNMPGWPWTSQ